MAKTFGGVYIAAAAVLLAALLFFHPWIPLGVGLHLRGLIAGLFPWLALLAPAYDILRRFGGAEQLPALERFLYASFLAVTLSAVVSFILLTLGLLYPFTLPLVGVILIALYRRWWGETLQNIRLPDLPRYIPSSVERFLCASAFIVLLAAALLPPVGYDAHEYHLAVPQGYLDAHSWIAFPLNVYAGFPMNTEMIYLWPLSLGSAVGCTVINLLLAAITVLSLALYAQRVGAVASLAALIFLTTGMTLLLTIHADIDLALSCCGMLLLYGYERYRDEELPVHFWMMVAALGFALGAKYIAALSILAPFMVLLLVDGLTSGRWKLIWAGALVILGGLLLFAPWAVRNLGLYSNPFYPLLNPFFQGEPIFYHELFQAAHSPKPQSFLQNVQDFFLLLPQRSVIAEESLSGGYSALWLLGLPLIWLQRRNMQFWRVLSFILAIYICWFFLTQRNDRFLAPMLPLMALLPAWAVQGVADGASRAWLRGILLCGVAIQLWGMTAFFQNETMNYLRSPSLEVDYLAERLPHYRAIEWLNRQMEEGHRVGRVLFVGEAQTFGAHFQTIAPTVFNFHPLERGLPPGVTHVIYNGSELDRLQRGYGPLGWPLGDFLRNWIEQRRGTSLNPVFDAYPENPGRVVVFEVRE